ncbi:phosphatase PAP2 family protein [Rossellomorea marisflavi]|uniref:Phosphatase PAP2 family protein n=1 Tax=Rossellomorea marisflavi TaxID=189381 RepID=A0A5D4S3H2_9BACI|nr:phosphatase PAP2 family protein [Rossellomorea marisflavi]KQU59909.1 hypothetical protein ASG66_09470 [Bacillus sp. Leaf406]VXB99847.1 conserved membrane hypothetical protein [Bacillus sp. 349Y]MDR4936656.1 phosphatase PAP2 family protein [Rossellomorea marisflavi]MDW4527003.1 phosphatase PAP2 family protein [Rossellomorea marisflavi]TYS56306.1 phosphatase PAP2 family protein [Rossellomorea marisflavi]
MEGRDKKTWAALILGVAFLVLFTWGFISIVDELRENEVESFDKAVIDFVQGFISPKLTTIMTSITFLGGVMGIAMGTIISIVILLFLKKVPLAAFMAITVGIGGAFNSLLKSLFKRDRPDFHVLIEQGGYSFPSGHSMGSFIFYGAIAFMLYRAFDRHLYKWISIVIAIGLILVIGTSRVYLGVHYPSDIVGGYSAGGAWLIVSILAYSYLAKRYKWWNKDEKKA